MQMPSSDQPSLGERTNQPPALVDQHPTPNRHLTQLIISHMPSENFPCGCYTVSKPGAAAITVGRDDPESDTPLRLTAEWHVCITLILR
jgi:hypothetical protein